MPRNALRYLLLLLGSTLAYYVAAMIGVKLIESMGDATPLWPGTGLAIVLLLRFGYRVWPAIAIGSFLMVEHTSYVISGPAALGIALGNTGEGLLGAFLVRRFCPEPRLLDHANSVFVFVAIVVPICSLASAGVGALSVFAVGALEGERLVEQFLTWWLGNVVGTFIVAPLLLSWSEEPAIPWRAREYTIGASLLVSLGLAGGIAFGGLLPLGAVDAPLGFLMFPIALGAAYRLGPRGASAATMVAAVIAIAGTLQGYGPFAHETSSVQESIFLQDAFLGVLSVATVLIGAVSVERYQADQDLRRAHHELEERVEERTADLVMANDWLKKAFEERARSEERAKESERLASIGTLATGIAHEMNNPLASILMAAEYAKAASQRTGGEKILQNSLDNIVRQAKRGGGIVESVLRFARKEPTEKWPNDLNTVIRSALDVTRKTVEEGGVNVRLQLDESLPEIQINPFEMEQVFVNLINNAVEASGPQGIVTIRTDAGPTAVRVCFEDNGPGIAEPERKRVFDPFFTTRQREGGTGLGLSIAHGIVMQHNGEIVLESEPGLGTRVAVRLPLYPEIEPADG